MAGAGVAADNAAAHSSSAHSSSAHRSSAYGSSAHSSSAHSSAPPASHAVLDLADTFVALMRSAHRAKARFVAAAEHDVEWSAQIILRMLANEGPMRASAIAENLNSDPSTVSRQVAGLVKDGLVERQADPEDGRASILVLTPKADGVLAAYNEQRARHFEAMLSEWSEADLVSFAGQLRRFTADFDRASAHLSCKHDATSETTGSAARPRHVSTEGHH